MSSASVTAAVEVKPPVEGNITVISSTTTSAATAIPDEWRGRQVTFLVTGDSVNIVFGDSSVEADPTATSGDTRCWKLLDGAEKDFFIRKNPDPSVTHFALESDNSTVLVRAYAS